MSTGELLDQLERLAEALAAADEPAAPHGAAEPLLTDLYELKSRRYPDDAAVASNVSDLNWHLTALSGLHEGTLHPRAQHLRGVHAAATGLRRRFVADPEPSDF